MCTLHCLGIYITKEGSYLLRFVQKEALRPVVIPSQGTKVFRFGLPHLKM